MQLTDQKILEVTKLLYQEFKTDQNAQRLDPDRLPQFKHEHIKPLYPHRVDESGQAEKYSCNEACCQVSPGRFFCGNTTIPDSSFKKLGLGLCLYFKFMRHICMIFLIIACVSVLSCGICYGVAIANGFQPGKTAQSVFFTGTMGVFSSEHIKCEYSKISANSVSFKVECPYGQVNLLGATYSDESLNSLYFCKLQRDKYDSADSEYHVTAATQTTVCGSENHDCDISMVLGNNPNTYLTVAYNFYCSDQVYPIGSISIKSQDLVYILVSFDLVFVIMIIGFYFSEQRAEKKEIEYFKEEHLSLNDFSVKITGFDLNTLQHEFDLMIRSFRHRLGPQLPDNLVQVKLPDRSEFVEYQQGKNTAYQRLYDFMWEHYFDQGIDPKRFVSVADFRRRKFAGEEDYHTYQQSFSVMLRQFLDVPYNPQTQLDEKQASIYLVMNSIGAKKVIYDMQNDGCFSNYLMIHGREYKISEPPAPDLILWQNKGKNMCLRITLSWLITFVICFASYVLFGFIQYEQNKLLSDYNFDIDCQVLFPNTQFVTFDPNNSEENYLTCFCSENLLDFDHPDSERCSDWNQQYATYLAIPIVISLMLVLYNVIVSVFFRMLTRIESHRLITDQLFSYTIKRAFLLVMNMALIMILLNMKYDTDLGITEVSFLLSGRYKDLTPDWYINIGAIIIMTMIFNIGFPIIELMLASVLKCAKQCWDRRCLCRKTSCKTKQEYVDLYINDVYPIQERYAFLIATILITLSFSCVIPILNIICFISIFLLYFSDRLLVFKLYQTPPNFGTELHRIIGKAIYLGLVAHMVLTAFFLSQPLLIAQNSSLEGSGSFNIGNERVNNMLNVYYIMPYTILFLVFAVWGVFTNTFVALYNRCTGCCKKKQDSFNKNKLEQTFINILSDYQITKLKVILEAQLNKINHKNRVQSVNHRNMANETARGLQAELTPDSDSEQPSQHYLLLVRTLQRLQKEQQLRRGLRRQEDIFLFGLPGYEMMMDDDRFRQNHKNMQLEESLKNKIGEQAFIARPTVKTLIGNDQL